MSGTDFWRLAQSSLDVLSRQKLRDLANEMQVKRGKDKADTIQNLIASHQFRSMFVRLLLSELTERVWVTSDGYKLTRTVIWTDGDNSFADRRGRPVDCNGYELEGRFA